MSRRSRRRGTRVNQGWLGKAALALIVAGVVLAGVLYAVVRNYLYSDSFRRFLSAKASQVARVEGEFTRFRWDGLAVDTDTFEGAGDGLIKSLLVEGLHTEVGVKGLRRGVWEIHGSSVQRLAVDIDARGHDATAALATPPPAPEPDPARGRKGWLPRQVELHGIEVRDVAAKALFAQGQALVAGMRVRVEPGSPKTGYRIAAADGRLRLPLRWLPEIRVQRANLRYQDQRLFLKSLTAAVWQNGELQLAGEWDRPAGIYQVEGAVAGVKCDEVFNEDWSKRFSGTMNTTFQIANPDDAALARGHLAIQDGVLTALPVLDVLAAYADTRRFRTMALSEAKTDWRWKKDELWFTNLVLASEGLVRVQGNLAIRGRELDGTFRLGLAPGTLATIPGAETHVFSAGELGLMWTPLRITGTLDDPKEDLTDRLMDAAGQRLFEIIPETGEQVIKYTRSLLREAPGTAVDTGVKIIEEGNKTLRDVTDIFSGILGGAGTTQANPPAPPHNQTPPGKPPAPVKP